MYSATNIDQQLSKWTLNCVTSTCHKIAKTSLRQTVILAIHGLQVRVFPRKSESAKSCSHCSARIHNTPTQHNYCTQLFYDKYQKLVDKEKINLV